MEWTTIVLRNNTCPCQAFLLCWHILSSSPPVFHSGHLLDWLNLTWNLKSPQTICWCNSIDSWIHQYGPLYGGNCKNRNFVTKHDLLESSLEKLERLHIEIVLAVLGQNYVRGYSVIHLVYSGSKILFLYWCSIRPLANTDNTANRIMIRTTGRWHEKLRW